MTDVHRRAGAPVQRVFHPVAVHFKGKGFYNTDYGTKRRAREMEKSASDGAAKNDAKTAEKKDKKADTKAVDLLVLGRQVVVLVLVLARRRTSPARKRRTARCLAASSTASPVPDPLGRTGSTRGAGLPEVNVAAATPSRPGGAHVGAHGARHVPGDPRQAHEAGGRQRAGLHAAEDLLLAPGAA